MGEERNFWEQSRADQLALIGNILIVAGSMAVSVSQLLRLSANGRIGEQVISPTPAFSGTQNNNNSAATTRAREFFL